MLISTVYSGTKRLGSEAKPEGCVRSPEVACYSVGTMLKRGISFVVVVAVLGFMLRWVSERVLTVDLRQDIVIDAPPRAVWEILSKARFHKIDPLHTEPLTMINRHARASEITEWKLKGNRSTLIGKIETELTVISSFFDFSVRINASNWLVSDVIVFRASELEKSNKTTLTEERQMYFPWMVRVVFQSRIISESKEQVRQSLENAVTLVEAERKK